MLINGILEVFIDSLLDVLKMVPAMFVVLVLADLLVNKIKSVKAKSSPLGVVIAALVGLIPQCGASAGFAQLYVQDYVGPAVALTAFLSCSDEALIVAAGHGSFLLCGQIILSKMIISLLTGLAVFFAAWLSGRGAKPAEEQTVELEECEHCKNPNEPHEHKHEKPGLLSLAKKHAYSVLKLSGYIFLTVFALNLVLHFTGFDSFGGFTGALRPLEPVVTAFIGILPSCVPSVVLTESYLGGVIGFGSLIAGLCANTGYGIVILFRYLPVKRAAAITAFLLAVSVLAGEILLFVM